MATLYQKKRVYSLTLGDSSSGNAVVVSGLQIRFDISKTSDNKKGSNNGVVEVYNLSPSTIELLQTDYLVLALDVGYEATGTTRLLSGNVVEVSTVRNGSDIITHMQVGEGYVELNHTNLNKLVAPGKTVKDVLDEIVTDMPSISRGAFVGTNINQPVIYGYPLHGTAKDMLTELARTYKLEWRVTGNTLSVSDENGLTSKDKTQAPVISASSGLIEIPYKTSAEGRRLKKDERRRQGVQFKALLNPTIVPGSIVQLVVSEKTDGVSSDLSGWYRVNTARYSGDFRGNDWYVECFCSVISNEELE